MRYSNLRSDNQKWDSVSFRPQHRAVHADAIALPSPADQRMLWFRNPMPMQPATNFTLGSKSR